VALKKSELYSSLWSSCDELRGGMDASQYKDYILVLLFIKYVSDKYAGQPFAPITIPEGSSFKDMVALKGKSDIGDQINKKIIARQDGTAAGAAGEDYAAFGGRLCDARNRPRGRLCDGDGSKWRVRHAERRRPGIDETGDRANNPKYADVIAAGMLFMHPRILTHASKKVGTNALQHRDARPQR
jgi:HsdM N-terminal domain